MKFIVFFRKIIVEKEKNIRIFRKKAMNFILFFEKSSWKKVEFP